MNYPFTLAAPVGSINASMRSLGATLRAARLGRGFNVRRQAGRAGLSPETVERIERGACTVSFGEVIALCMSLGVSLQPQQPGGIPMKELMAAPGIAPKALSSREERRTIREGAQVGMPVGLS